MIKSCFFSNFLEWYKITEITHRDNTEIRFQKGKRFSDSNKILITKNLEFAQYENKNKDGKKCF